jgi:hypothetical protein
MVLAWFLLLHAVGESAGLLLGKPGLGQGLVLGQPYLLPEQHEHVSLVGLARTVCVGLARTIYIYIRCMCGIFGREITKNTVIYGVYIRFWPNLRMCAVHVR